MAEGEQDPAAARAVALAELTSSGIDPEYLELVSADTLDPVQRIDGDVLALVAAQVGATRLIDNELIKPLPAAGNPTVAASADHGRP